jgi:outer membrane protein OmpA-like peptidoglycan-associated protein
MKSTRVLSGVVAAIAFCIAPASGQVERTASVPIYRVNVVARTTKAINYRHRSGSTKVDFQGTALMPAAGGDAKVESHQGYLEVDAHFKNMEPASKYGPEYLTYVLWAITPEGRPKNLGEVVLNGAINSKLDVTSELQAFGLIVTAEPYFAVTTPSDAVVMENVVRADTLGKIEDIDAKYELLPRGQYIRNVAPSDVRAKAVADPKRPLEVLEARNAVQIAEWVGADRYAHDTYQKAVQLLDEAENYQARRHPEKKSAAMIAREAVQTAEDARLITLKRAQEEDLAKERQSAADRETIAKAQAETEAQRRQQAEQAQAQAQQATAQAQQATAKAVQEQARLEAARSAAEAQQRAAQSEAEKARLAAEEANRLRGQAEQDKAALKEQLRQQLTVILETRSTARGLIVNMSDVLFDTAKYTLKPGAREKLAKIAGILLAHPTLGLQIEGHTDSVGGDDYNQRLSEQRAGSVRDYLVQQGIPVNHVTAMGFGKTQPVADNATAAGRQQNRRVELVVAGEEIGNTVPGR